MKMELLIRTHTLAAEASLTILLVEGSVYSLITSVLFDYYMSFRIRIFHSKSTLIESL